MNGLWIALGFLSRLPAPRVTFSPRGLTQSLFWFPAVGALLGLMWWAAFTALSGCLSPTLVAFVMVLIGVLFTGGLHLDGVADTFDGLSASASGEERALAAMRDSRIGAHGAVALVVTLLGKFVAFESLKLEVAAVVCFGAAVSARLGCALVVALVKPARSSGLGASFAGADGRDPPGAAPRPGALSACGGVIWLLIPFGIAGTSPARWAAVAIATTAAFAGGTALLRRVLRSFGGVTGDTHGAFIEVSETILLLSGAALGARFG